MRLGVVNPLAPLSGALFAKISPSQDGYSARARLSHPSSYTRTFLQTPTCSQQVKPTIRVNRYYPSQWLRSEVRAQRLAEMWDLWTLALLLVSATATTSSAVLQLQAADFQAHLEIHSPVLVNCKAIGFRP